MFDGLMGGYHVENFMISVSLESRKLVVLLQS